MKKKKVIPREYQFKPGVSGNPHGRPKMSKSERELREMIKQAAPDIIDKMIQVSKKGSHNAANLLLKKILPDLSSVEVKEIKEEPEDDSIYTEEQLRAIKAKEDEIEAIKNGGSQGNETQA